MNSFQIQTDEQDRQDNGSLWIDVRDWYLDLKVLTFRDKSVLIHSPLYWNHCGIVHKIPASLLEDVFRCVSDYANWQERADTKNCQVIIPDDVGKIYWEQTTIPLDVEKAQASQPLQRKIQLDNQETPKDI